MYLLIAISQIVLRYRNRDAELRIFEAEAADKPEEIRAKIAAGKLAKWYSEVVLLDQPSVSDSKKTVKALLDEAGVTITRFVRFEVGQH